MKMTVGHILAYRSLYKRKCYVMETPDEVFYIVYGSRYRIVTNNDVQLSSRIARFKTGTLKWDTLDSSIAADRDAGFRAMDNNWWVPITEEFELKVLDIVDLYIDGEKHIE